MRRKLVSNVFRGNVGEMVVEVEGGAKEYRFPFLIFLILFSFDSSYFCSFHLSRVELSRKVNWRTLSKNQSGRLKR